MALTTAQLATLKTDIIAKSGVGGPLQQYGQTDFVGIAYWYSLTASPDFWVFRKGIPSGEIGKSVNYVAVAAMTTANLQRVSDFLRMNLETFDGRDDVKTFLNDTFSGALGGQGQATRDALDAMLRKKANNAERLFATGTGTTVAPGTMVVEGNITADDVQQALR